jgi:hypothetical protein
MSIKKIKAVISDAMFAESFVETPQGEQFVGSVEMHIRDIETDEIYIKKLTEQDLCEITGIEKNFSPLELIKIAEFFCKHIEPIEIVVDEDTHLITNEMIMFDSKKTKTVEPAKQTVGAKKNFGFNPKELKNRAPKSRSTSR